MYIIFAELLYLNLTNFSSSFRQKKKKLKLLEFSPPKELNTLEKVTLHSW